MVRQCSNCYYGRVACVKGLVGCRASIQTGSPHDIQEGLFAEAMSALGIDEITTGWVALPSLYRNKDKEVRSGAITNFVAVFEPTFYCKLWKE